MCQWLFPQPGLLIGSQDTFSLVKYLQTASESTSSEETMKCGQFPCRCCKSNTNIPNIGKMPPVSWIASIPMQWYMYLCFPSSTPPFKPQVGKWARNGLKASLGTPKTQDWVTMTYHLRGEANVAVTNSTRCHSIVMLTQQRWAPCVQVRSRELISSAKPQLGIQTSTLGSLKPFRHGFVLFQVKSNTCLGTSLLSSKISWVSFLILGMTVPRDTSSPFQRMPHQKIPFTEPHSVSLDHKETSKQ